MTKKLLIARKQPESTSLFSGSAPCLRGLKPNALTCFFPSSVIGEAVISCRIAGVNWSILSLRENVATTPKLELKIPNMKHKSIPHAHCLGSFSHRRDCGESRYPCAIKHRCFPTEHVVKPQSIELSMSAV